MEIWDRDKRTEKIQHIEYDYLAPDTINEMFTAMSNFIKTELDTNGNGTIDGIENSHRKTEVVKVKKSIELFKELISFYGVVQLMEYIKSNSFSSFEELKKSIPVKITRSEWKNIGGQLMPSTNVETLKKKIKTDKIKSGAKLHDFYPGRR